MSEATDPTLEPIRRDLESFLQSEWSDASLRVDHLGVFGRGHSGYTYRVDLRGKSFSGPAVLRTSPPGTRIAGPADIERQARIMQALSHSGVPVPPVLATSPTARLDGRSFALTDVVQGVSWEETLESYSHEQVARSAVDVLLQLRELDVSETGIGDEEPVDPLAEIERWSKLLSRAPDDLRPLADSLRTLLDDAAPPLDRPRLVHGDFHYANLLFDKGKVAAVLDWEISEIGATLMDMGSLAVASIRNKFKPEPNQTGRIEITLDELLAMYGSSAEAARWFVAASCYKYSAILVYNLMLHRNGKRNNPHWEKLLGTMAGLMHEGINLLKG